MNFPVRGCYREKDFGLATRFPFAFLMKRGASLWRAK